MIVMLAFHEYYDRVQLLDAVTRPYMQNLHAGVT